MANQFRNAAQNPRELFLLGLINYFQLISLINTVYMAYFALINNYLNIRKIMGNRGIFPLSRLINIVSCRNGNNGLIELSGLQVKG